MKTIGKILTALLLTAALTAGLTACGGGGEDEVYAQSVASLNGMAAAAFADRFAGVAVSGKTAELRLDPALTLEDVKVEEGQTVKKGDVLFTYNNDSAALRVEEAKLEIESQKNKISALNSQIADLTRERAAAANADKLSYTLEIQGLQADIRETEYNIAVKEKELQNLEKTAADTQVKSEIDGRVTSINRAGGTNDDGSEKPFMTVVETGSLRVKGTINELNRGLLSEGQAVTLRARTDTARTWRGTVQTIDWENPAQGNGNNYYSGSPDDEMTSSSKYPFYVAVEDPAGLIIGQHVYIEPGEAETPAADGGLRLPEAFVSDADDAPWVWAVNGGGKLEKRKLAVSAYDEALGEYVIESGLTLDDYVAFPEEGLRAGQPAVKTDGFIGMDDGTFEDPSDGDFSGDGIDFDNLSEEEWASVYDEHPELGSQSAAEEE